MKNILSNIIYWVRQAIKMFMPKFAYTKKSFSQNGEDIIIKNLFRSLGVKNNIRYLDIGSNHPFSLSNSALLYYSNSPRGGGVLVEPNPDMARLLKFRRAFDTVLNLGVSPKGRKEILPFYIMDQHVLSTFSKSEVQKYQKMGHKVIKEMKIQTISINKIFEEYYPDGNIDFMTIDTEGLDIDILKTINYKKYKPKVICVETSEYGTKRKQRNIFEFLDKNGYSVYAETGLNTIFILQRIYK